MKNNIAPLHSTEKAFWEKYLHSVDTSAPASRDNMSKKIRESGMEDLLEDENIPMDLACVITLICERTKHATGPTRAYKDAYHALGTLTREKRKCGEQGVIQDIRSRYKITMMEE